MKKFLTLCLLLAAFSVCGCAADTPAAETPKVPAAAPRTENKVPDRKEQLLENHSKTMEKIEKKYGGRPMIGQPSSGEIHHFTK